MFLNRTLAASVALVMTLTVGCTEDDGVVNPAKKTTGFDAATLMGLVSDRVLVYLQSDTITGADLSMTDTSYERVITITGADNDWIVRDNDKPVANLKINDESVTLNGYWLAAQAVPTLKYIAVPPVLIKRRLAPGASWQGYTPEVDFGSGQTSRIFAFCYFGFFFTKEYVGTELIYVPAQSFLAHRYDVKLYRSHADTEPVAEVREYYESSVGLVQLNFRGGPTNSTLSLIASQ